MIRERFEVASATVALYDPSFDGEGRVLRSGIALVRALTAQTTERYSSSTGTVQYPQPQSCMFRVPQTPRWWIPGFKATRTHASIESRLSQPRAPLLSSRRKRRCSRGAAFDGPEALVGKPTAQIGLYAHLCQDKSKAC